MKTLVAGWFSFIEMGASAGDLLTRDLVCQWLGENTNPYDVALVPPFKGGIDWHSVNPSDYKRVIFVCGPFGNGPPVDEMLIRFSHCDWIGINLSMLQSLDEWNPFKLLLERDSSRTIRPDLAFLASAPPVMVVGKMLIDSQPEYGDRDHHERVEQAIDKFLDSRDVAVLTIDTRLDQNASQSKSSAQVEALISCVNVVITTRLHGLVLSLKNGIPAVAIDSVQHGAKLTRQAEAIGWRTILSVDDLSQERLEQAFEYCISEQARSEAKECSSRARISLMEVWIEFRKYLNTPR